MQANSQHRRVRRALSLPLVTVQQSASSTGSTLDLWSAGSSENFTSESTSMSRQRNPLPPDGAAHSEQTFRRRRYSGLPDRPASPLNRASVQDVYDAIVREAPDAKVSHIFHAEQVATPGLIPITGPHDFPTGFGDSDSSFILVDGHDDCSDLAVHMLRSRAGRFGGVVIVVLLEQSGTASSFSIKQHVSILAASGADDIIVAPMGAAQMSLTISVSLAKVKEQAAYTRNLKKHLQMSRSQCHGLFWEVAHELVDDFPQVRPDVYESREKRVGPMAFVRKLGAGQFGSVFVCQENGRNHEGAVKVLSKSRIDSIQSILQIVTEFTALKKLNHPNVVKLHSVLHGIQNLYLFMDMAGTCTLLKMILSEGANGMQWRKGHDVLQQITDGVAHCHEMNVAHCDLKPENVVISSEGCARLVDFGQAVETALAVPSLQVPRGTMPFVAPEVMRLSPSWDPCAVDVWAVGVIFVEVLGGNNAFVRLLNWQGTNLTSIPGLPRRASDLETFFMDEDAAVSRVSGCCRDMLPESVIRMLGNIFKLSSEERLAAKRVFDTLSGEHTW